MAIIKYNKELDCDFNGTEACWNCGNEFDFSHNPMQPKLIICSHCGTKQHPCSLCDCHIVDCGESKDCFWKIAYVLEEYNKEESEDDNMEFTVTMCVYYDTIEPDYKGDDNLAYIKANKNMVRDYFDYNISSDFHSKIGEPSFENWLIEYTADDTTGLYIYLMDRDAIDVIYTPGFGNIEYKDDYCNVCECGVRIRKTTSRCHRCGQVIKSGSSFLNDYEKMIDFFVLSKDEFLKFYSYLSEDDYIETEKEIIDKSGYWNDQWIENNPDYDGRHLKDICLGIMLKEWLCNK